MGKTCDGFASAIGLPTAAFERAFAELMPRDREGEVAVLCFRIGGTSACPGGEIWRLISYLAPSLLSRPTTPGWPMTEGDLCCCHRFGEEESGS